MTTLEGRGKEEKKKLGNLHIHLNDGVGNSTVSQRLNSFVERGMKGPNAAHDLLSMIAPVDIGQTDKHSIIRDGNQPSKSLFDQVSWAYARDSNPTKIQKKEILNLQEKALKSLAEESQERKVRHNGKGNMYDLSPDVKEKANMVYEEYQKALKLLDESKPGHIHVHFNAIAAALIGLAGAGTLAMNAIIDNFGYGDNKILSTITAKVSPTPTAILPSGGQRFWQVVNWHDEGLNKIPGSVQDLYPVYKDPVTGKIIEEGEVYGFRWIFGPDGQRIYYPDPTYTPTPEPEVYYGSGWIFGPDGKRIYNLDPTHTPTPVTK